MPGSPGDRDLRHHRRRLRGDALGRWVATRERDLGAGRDRDRPADPVRAVVRGEGASTAAPRGRLSRAQFAGGRGSAGALTPFARDHERVDGLRRAPSTSTGRVTRSAFTVSRPSSSRGDLVRRVEHVGLDGPGAPVPRLVASWPTTSAVPPGASAVAARARSDAPLFRRRGGRRGRARGRMRPARARNRAGRRAPSRRPGAARAGEAERDVGEVDARHLPAVARRARSRSGRRRSRGRARARAAARRARASRTSTGSSCAMVLSLFPAAVPALALHDPSNT